MSKKLKTKLNGGFKTTTAVLYEGRGKQVGDIIGIIQCTGLGKGDITEKVIQAVWDYFKVPLGSIIKLNVNDVLTEHNRIEFYAEWSEEGYDQIIRDMIIVMKQTY